MSEVSGSPAQVGATTVPNLRLRGDQPRVTRLSRKVLIGVGAVSALAIAGAAGYALQADKKSGKGQELLNTQSSPSAEGLAGLPKDYAGLAKPAVPKLGPPLPGDLGKPMLSAGVAPSGEGHTQSPDSVAQQIAQEDAAARVSRLFTATNQSSSSAESSVGSAASMATATDTKLPPIDAGAAQNMQDRKIAFVNAATDKKTLSGDRLQGPISPYVVQAGTVISAALITGIRSDLPGQITAQVTEPVYDTPAGKYLLIPQGARLIGQYDSSVAFGQSRILLVWTRLVMPDGASIALDRLPGADPEGYAGLEDGVDNHWRKLFQAAALSTLLSVGAEAGTSQDENNLVQAIRSGASNSISQTGQQIVQRQLNIQPTLTVRSGFPVRVIVARDLVLEPYPPTGTP